MRLINNRYKLGELIYNTFNSSLYQGFDLWNNEKEVDLKFYNSERSREIIDYFTENFISISGPRHDNLISSYEFNIVNTIDSKKININQYFTALEYVDRPSLEEAYLELDLKERLDILVQIANVLDYLHYRGVVYRYLSPSNVFIMEDNQVKLRGLATIYENMLETRYDDLTRDFIATEVLLKQEDVINKKADKYSLGRLALYLLSDSYQEPYGDQYNYISDFQLSGQQKACLDEIISSCVMENPKLRIIELREIIAKLNQEFNLGLEYDLVKERGRLNFSTRIVGREKEIEKINKIDREIHQGKGYKNIILINGNEGTGKSRFLKEVAHILRLRGRNVYYEKFNPKDWGNFQSISNVLEVITKEAPKSIVDKYGRELSILLPEVKKDLYLGEVNMLEGQRDKLRIFDRISSFLKEVFQNQTAYIIFDDLEKCNLESFQMLDYLMGNIDEGRISLIASFNEKLLSQVPAKYEIVEKWRKDGLAEEIKLSNFNVEEIGESIQYILGISYKPVKFAAVVLRESQGNPKLIEYMMKDLYAKGEMYFSQKGYWEVKSKRFSDINFTTDYGEAIKRQINLIKDEHRTIVEIISAYYDSVSKNALQAILKTSSKELNNILQELVAIKLVDERVSDAGYSYSFNDLQLKRAVYHKIPEEERVGIHKKISHYLERIYRQNPLLILDELIHHLIRSNERERALEFIIENAKQTEDYSFKSIALWEEAFEVDRSLESKYSLEILKNLGDIYSMKGENKKALDIYKLMSQQAKTQGKVEYIIRANNGIADIYIKQNLQDLAQEKIEETKSLYDDTGDLELLIRAGILENRILLNKGEFDKVEHNLGQMLNITREKNLKQNLGDIYNIQGLIEYYKGDMARSEILYKESIEAFENVGDKLNSIKPRNNLASICTEHGEFSQAMDYYKKCLAILDNREVENLRLVILNNIGSIHMSMYQYEEAIGYLEEAGFIAVEIEDLSIEFISNINLSTIYLNSGMYDQSYNYYTIVKELVENKDYSYEMLGNYYNYLSMFYFTVGKYDESRIYSKKAIEVYRSYSIKDTLAAKLRLILADYYQGNIYNKEAMEEIRKKYRSIKPDWDRRDALLQLALVALLERDAGYLGEILEEDSLLKKDYPAPQLDCLREILENAMGVSEESIENLIGLEVKIKKHKLPQLTTLLNIVLGMKFSKQGKLYEGINRLLEALNIIYGLIKNIPDRNMQKCLVKKFLGDTIKKELNEILYEITSKTIEGKFIDDIADDESIGRYFDYRVLISLLDDGDFEKIREASFYVDKEVEDINNIEELIIRLSSDYKRNLELLLNFAVKETFATNAYILGYDEEANKYLPVVSLLGDQDWKPNENLLSLVNRYEEGVLISSNISKIDGENHSSFLPRNIKALMCIPIEIKMPRSFPAEEDRRKASHPSRINEGYIYLETDRIFNRFDEERHEMISNLSQVVYMNLENYKLKILSNIDKLTGISTRKYFEEEYNRIFNNIRTRQKDLAVLMLDIDNFKEVNDKYGHRKGDLVLTEIGSILKNNTRNTDLVARYGGEEFVIVLEDISKKKAKEIGEKIRQSVMDIRIPGIRETITLSVGIGLFPLHAQFKEELIEKADQALYYAKEEGKNRVSVWSNKLLSSFERIDSLAGIISGNIDEDQDNVLTILNTIDLIMEDLNKEEKIFTFLGRFIEAIDSNTGSLIILDKDGTLSKTYSRTRDSNKWEDEIFINYNIIREVVEEERGKFLIDWDSVKDVDLAMGNPRWKSTIAYPIKFTHRIRGVLYATVVLREKEFSYEAYNMAKTLGKIIAPIL